MHLFCAAYEIVENYPLIKIEKFIYCLALERNFLNSTFKTEGLKIKLWAMSVILFHCFVIFKFVRSLNFFSFTLDQNKKLSDRTDKKKGNQK